MKTQTMGRRRRRRIPAAVFSFVMVASLLATPAAAETSGLSVPEGEVNGIMSGKAEAVYVVMLADDPVIAYEGGLPGLAATKPAKGAKLNPNSAHVKKYQSHLNSKHAEALAAVGADGKFYDYTVSFNGFAAVLSGAEASALAKSDGVLAVWEDEIKFPDTDRSPDYLNMPAAWDQVGGQGMSGEDIIIGVIDTGIHPENPSFSDQKDAIVPIGHGSGNLKKNLAYGPAPAHWNGICQTGQQWTKNDCNNKLIGARWYADGFTNHEINISGDYKSARDRDGHGSHTASTAGGNVVETLFPTGESTIISGMAPRARIAAYKACWADAGCAGSDLVAAIDQAVADGVDVINYSIGSDAPSVSGPDDVAFLFAADSGVFVATSNGNAGPGANTTGSPSSAPWLTSVGAVDHGRNFLGTVDTGDGNSYSGASLSETVVSGSLVDSEDADNGEGLDAELCEIGSLDPAVVGGKIVLCTRGVFARVDKSAAVAEAGGIGMILFNPTPDSLNADTHSLPSIHVDHVDGPAIKAYIDAAGAGATATINEGGNLGIVNADVMAGFSSRGVGASEDIIKPDIIAPGVNVYAAGPPETFFGTNPNLAALNSGTSMASPHIAGIGALLKQAHPDWTPAMIKSALMTTADPSATLKEDQTTAATPLDQGSGLVQPGSAFDPGLVYDVGLFEYAAFTCGGFNVFTQGTCDFLAGLGHTFEASDLNQPNIAVGSLAGEQTVTRTVTALSAGTYEVSVDAPAGVDVVVSPTTLTLAEGDSESYTVEFTTTEAASIGDWTFGSLTWSDGSHDVTSALAVRPVQLAAPDEVFGQGVEGDLSFDVSFGYTGDYTVDAHGLFAAVTQPGNVVDDPANDINTALSTGVGITVHAVDVPAGTAYARFSLFDDYTDGVDDLDLYVFTSAGAFVDGSGSGTSAEEVNIPSPAADTYLVVVHGWQTDGPDSNYTLFNWNVAEDGTADDGSLAIDSAPASAVLGTTGTIDISWSGLAVDTKYLGAVSHADTGGVFGYTIVSVSTD